MSLKILARIQRQFFLFYNRELFSIGQKPKVKSYVNEPKDTLNYQVL